MYLRFWINHQFFIRLLCFWLIKFFLLIRKVVNNNNNNEFTITNHDFLCPIITKSKKTKFQKQNITFTKLYINRILGSLIVETLKLGNHESEKELLRKTTKKREFWKSHQIHAAFSRWKSVLRGFFLAEDSSHLNQNFNRIQDSFW